jgi:predicted GNAT family acetyltransferase
MTWKVIHNESNHRFEVHLTDGGLAQLAYLRKDASLNLAHTEVPPKWEGRGIAAELTRVALEYAQQYGLSAIASCPYVQVYLRRHPEYQTLVE